MEHAHDTPAAWFAIWTRSRHEHVVHDQLEHRAIEVFLPTITRLSRWNDRKKRVRFPLFPGYCFARFEPEQSVTVTRCPGVASVVTFDGKPAPIPHQDIEGIRALVASELQFDPCPLVHEGMMVEVVRGPLTGVVGRLVRKDAEHARLVLSVELINRAVAVNVDAADIERC